MEIERILSSGPPPFSHDAMPSPDEQEAHASTSSLPWTRSRQPFSPATMGHALPYLDVFTVQSKRLLPVSREELDGKRQQQQNPPRGGQQVEVLADEQANPSPRTSCSANVDDADVNGEVEDSGREKPGLNDTGTSPRVENLDAVATDVTSNEYLRVSTHPSEEMLRSVRLLVEPIAIPDLTHTGVLWQHAAGAGRGVRGDQGEAFCVTLPNHTFEETQDKLFYPTGAKKSNMREYIRNTIQAHMTGLLAHNTTSSSSPSHGIMNPSQSAPNLVPHVENDTFGEGVGTNSSPKHTKIKKRKQHSNSPSKFSPQKINGVSSGARLSGSVSTSGLLNPELTRQAKDILAQLRSNTNKINDLIGS